VLGGAVGEYHVLDVQLNQLVVESERVAVDVRLVAQLPKVVGGHVKFRGSDSGDGQVRHVVPNGTVFERRHAVFRAEDALLHRLGRLVGGGQPLHTF